MTDYAELVKILRRAANYATKDGKIPAGLIYRLSQAADAIEEMQTVLCEWCGVCPKDKRDLSTCEIYESCLLHHPREEGE